ncbi:MAG: response regulator [Patescibacteria group bacterium]|jgi:DNA-binding response OmpR family regulator|nr:response regulator [Patescibacteria group bacterium]
MTKKIAIIEDDVAIAQMYRIKFEAEGFVVETAENGVYGLELIQEMQPDMVLLDLMMPEMNGDEVLKQMRQQPWGANTKVIILTNMGEQEAPAIIKELGVEAFIVKADMTPRQVAELVKKHVGEVV